MQAGLFRDHSAHLATYLAKIAIKYLKAGLVEEARLFAEVSLREQRTRMGLLARSMIGMQEGRYSRHLVKTAFRIDKIRDPREIRPIPALRRSS